MKIETSSFGVQRIDPETVINFPQGMLAFENCTRFKLFHSEEFPDLKWLQSLDDEDVCFSIMEPHLFGCEYEFTLGDADTELLQTETPDDLQLYFMVYQGRPGTSPGHFDHTEDQAMNANWRAPLLINPEKRVGLNKLLVDAVRTVKITAA
ncbi:MAG: flagellar assembly protein FliW [Candidatus Sedimenticola sp. (ex Thyasira tokunagai)]